jgi:hypothetical protein
VTIYNVLLIVHILAFGLGLGMSFSNWWNNRLAQTKPDEFQKGLGLHRRAIGRIGDGVISAIWLSGIMLVVMRGWSDLGIAFATKMILVVGLTFCHVRARSMGEVMFREGHRNLLKEQGMFMMVAWMSAAVAIISAIIAFK